MGHIRLPNLHMTARWAEVVAAIRSGEAVDVVAARAADAAEAAFERAKSDPDFHGAIQLLAELPLAARSADYVSDLRRLGLAVSGPPTLAEFIAALAGALDQAAAPKVPGSDVRELATRALLGSFNAQIGPRLPSLFGAVGADLQHELGKYASGRNFGVLARDFFARFVQETLAYYLSRELGNHQGPGLRFSNSEARAAFDEGLSRHAWEAARIVEEYAGGWLGKHVYQEGGLTPEGISSFGSYSLKKIVDELKRRRDA